MQAGKLNKRITIEAVSVVKDARGQNVETWNPVATVWAHVRQLAGREAVVAAQVNEEATWAVTIRWRDDMTRNPTRNRIVYGQRRLQLLTVIDANEKRRTLEIAAKEHQADG